MLSKTPWEIHPALQKERLVILARLIANVRHGAVKHARPQLGDGTWVVGCTVHSRTAAAIRRAIKSKEYPWLSIKARALCYIVGIDGVPIRIYRGHAFRPTDSAKTRNLIERSMQMEAFEKHEMGVPTDAEWVWRIAVDTDSMGRATQIVILQLGPGDEVRNAYTIDYTEAPSVIPGTAPIQRAGKDLGKPLVGPKPLPVRETDTEAAGKKLSSSGDNEPNTN